MVGAINYAAIGDRARDHFYYIKCSGHMQVAIVFVGPYKNGQSYIYFEENTFSSYI